MIGEELVRYCTMVLNLSVFKANEYHRLCGIDETQPLGVRDLLVFTEPPTEELMLERAAKIADIAEEVILKRMKWTPEQFDAAINDKVWIGALIGGPPWFMYYMEEELLDRGIHPIYTFTQKDPDHGSFHQTGWHVCTRE